jgi:2-isopropylmalate synthase
VLALRTHAASMGLDTEIDTIHIAETSRLVSELTGYGVPRNKAIVGANAFTHESGIHQHGVLADRRTYEHLDAAALGFVGGQIVLGKHSGRHAIAAVLAESGVELPADRLDAVFAAFKTLADERGTVTHETLRALAEATTATATDKEPVR